MTEQKILSTPNAPSAIGPYSQGVQVAQGLIFTSGQIPLDPGSGSVVAGGIKEQTRRVLQNLSAILDASGSSLASVVKTTVFLADMNDFAAMNEVYATFFASRPPARTTVQVARLPRDVKVEIEAIALAG